MSPKKSFWVFFLTLILGSSIVWAGPVRKDISPRERTWERIRTIKMLKMTEALQLDRDHAARFFAIDNQYEESKRKLHREFRENVRKLRTLMQEGTPPDRELRDLLTHLRNQKRELDDLMIKQNEEELNFLKPEQQARYLLFQIDFHREIENLIREVRSPSESEGAPERLK
jgi:hypothetical protein